MYEDLALGLGAPFRASASGQYAAALGIPSRLSGVVGFPRRIHH
jgi:hypothetical protein